MRRTAAALLATTVGVCLLVATTPSGALASPSGNARDRAHALHVQLAALQTKAEAATEDYNAAQDQLGQVVTQHILSQRQLQTAQSDAADAGALEAATVRALYRTGGPAALYATVLQGSNPGDVFARLQAVQGIVNGQHAAAHRAAAVVEDAATIEARLGDLAHKQTQLQKTVSASMRIVEATLAQQQALVAAADAEVLALEKAEAEAAAAAAASNASVSLAQARAAAVPGGVGDVPPPNTALVAQAIGAARQQLGKPYRWGATGPETFDCSGLTGWVYRQAGVSLPRTSRQQWFAGVHPGLGYLQPGDLLFWASNTANPATIHHVAIYIGNDQMIAAPHTGANVAIQPVYLNEYIGAVRPTQG
jgi:cell wall-associated NlpC family hydrolase